MLGGSALHAIPDLEHGLAVQGRAPVKLARLSFQAHHLPSKIALLRFLRVVLCPT